MLQFLLTQIGKIKAAVSSINLKITNKLDYYNYNLSANEQKIITVAGSSRLLIVFCGSATARCGEYIVSAASDGGLNVVPVLTASSVTIDSETMGKLKVTSTQNTNMYVCVLSGSVE